MLSKIDNKCLDDKTPDVANNSRWNPIDESGRVHDRWHHGSNPTRITWLGDDGLSYWAEGRKVFQTVLGDKQGQETLVMLARDHEEQDNYYFNSQRLQDYGYQNAVDTYEANPPALGTHPENLLVDPNQESVFDMAFPAGKEPTKREELTERWHAAVNEVTAGHPEKLALYKRRYQEGVDVGAIVQEQYEATGKTVSNQAMSEKILRIVKKAYKHMTGEEMPKIRDSSNRNPNG